MDRAAGMFGECRLPAQPNPLIGREDDLARLRGLLLREGVRLVTLTGPGGVGKTRLAVECAATLAERFPDGVHFVDLAPLGDAALVPSAIVRALDIEESGARTSLDVLTTVLRDRSLLLLVDTLEHLLPAAGELAALLTACPNIRVLATSRVPLRLRWEHELAVPPLALPSGDDRRVATLAGNPSVALLLERTGAVRAGFKLTDENASAAAAIVNRLEGLPLAIELAAARLRSMPPALLLAMLDDRLGTLTGGPLDAPDRQKSVRDSIAWSYQLLAPELQALLRRLSVFPGGCTLDGAAEVNRDSPSITNATALTLESITKLCDAHLLRAIEPSDDLLHYRMFDTVREFAAEQLETSGEADQVRRRLAEYVLALAIEAEHPIKGGRREAWLARLDAELDTILAALAWCRDTPSAVELGLGIATTLDMYWHFRDHWREASGWLEALLASPYEKLPAIAAEARCALGRLAVFLREESRAEALLIRALEGARDLDEQRVEAYALLWLARLARDRGDVRESHARATESVSIFRTLDEPWALALALGYLGGPSGVIAGSDAARAALEESVARFRRLEDGWGMAFSLEVLAHVFERNGDLAGARRAVEETLSLRRAAGVNYALASSLASLADLLYLDLDFAASATAYGEAAQLRRELGLTHELASALRRRGHAFLRLNRPRDALGCLQESLTIFHERRDAQQSGLTLAACAAVAAAGGDFQAESGLASAAEIVVVPADVRAPIERSAFDSNRAAARSGDTAIVPESRAGGEPWSLDEAVQCALSLNPPPDKPRYRGARVTALPDGLSEREGEVLALLAAGRSNREIADRLILSVRTVEKHVARLYAKIGARGRADAATYAVRHGIDTRETSPVP